jgi:nucleoside phosphorylase
MNAQADVLLVTVTKVESLAVLAAFEPATGQKARLEARGDKAYHDLGTVNGAHVWLARSEMGAGGLGAAQQSVSKAIAELRPAAVLMVGIAFGLDAPWQKIGDILVSENLRLYEPQRAGPAATLPRGDRPHGSPWLLDACKNADLHWPGATVRFGCILTGEKLVDHLDLRAQLRAFEPEALGGEMEGAGLYTACQDAKVDWLLVKAICDWADGDKETDRQPRQQLAARNAAEFVLHVLQQVSLKSDCTSESAGTAGARTFLSASGRAKERGKRTRMSALHPTGSGAVVVGNGNVTAGPGGVAIGGDHHGDITLH